MMRTEEIQIIYEDMVIAVVIFIEVKLSPLPIAKWKNLFPPLRHSRSRMTTAITFSRQNESGSRESTTWYWANLVLIVLLVLESKDVY